MSEARKVYFNKKQLEAMAIAARNEYIIASRGFGKSEGIDAPRVLRNVFAMPRSSGALLSPTYGKLLRNTLPAIFHALDRLGYKRNVHYFVGRKPEKKLNFATPYIDPFNYDYVISWFNGSIQHLISFERPMSANSMSLDYVFGFEAKFLDFEKVKNEVLPANRGNNNYFAGCPWHHGVLFSSDMPTNRSGMWLLEKEKEMDPDLIQTIRQTYLRIKMLEKESMDSRNLKELRKDLTFFRSQATLYAEYNVFDNLELLSSKFIADMKRDLPPLIFQTAILNKRMRKVENGFYSALNEKIHYYEAWNNPFLEALGYEPVSNDCRKDGDLYPDKPLLIAMDYNSSINNLVVGQHLERELRTVSSFYVKTPRKLKDVVNAFCDYYHYHTNHNVVYYYDSTAIANTPLDASSLSDTVQEVLTARGWNCTAVYIGQQMKHNLKHHYIDLALKGDPEFLFPTFNKDNNEYLLLAMEQTGIKIGRLGFEKNKNAEKDADTPENPDELKTHVTDAWDTLFIGANYYSTDADQGSMATDYGK